MPATQDPVDRAARVLVVDDEESITQLVSTVLRYEGFEVECAANGRTAVRMAGRFRPDLVVLDVMLPVVGGAEVLERLRGDASFGKPRVVVLSAWSHERENLLAAGADRFVTKPFDPDELRRIAVELLEAT
jgi:two-component system, OmpR family, response regulator